MAARKPSVRHPSHNHPLRSHKAQVEEEIICSGCDLDLIGAAFKCTKSECDYFLHKSCFELPRETRHKAHPDHPLTLLYSPPYESTYTCDACGEYGSGFTYNCSICQYDVHVGCVSMPESVEREGHAHPLTLLYRSPYQNGLIFNCDVCQETVPDNLWSYYCKECDYGTHLHSCAVEEEEAEEEEPKRGGGSARGNTKSGGNKGGRGSAASELAAMLEAQREMEKMQIELHMEMQRAKIAKKARKACLKLI
ncbi:putative chromatin regulator PHD family [Arabidopsis thaliana]|uniref:DC1 domain-containing protein n=3 Tax=Arabidopsis TaxID=3701 RepID=A0A178VYL5_ARATH|nr:DC1 [Arabidopsis thaliana x Arabidopsis arenosa]KAG7644270.1 DC1 [Arabidopsis suecica]OAP11389.1 hypothetical protein AXX17_AT2G41930 [Arabidopsis thaliana]